MKLVADVGNTNTVFGIWNDGKILNNWRISTGRLETEDEMYVVLKQLLEAGDTDLKSIEDICVASVVPRLNSIFHYFGKKYLKLDPILVTAIEGIGVKWDVDFPSEIGADRVANVVGAHEFYGENAVVIDTGTAITVDILKDGAFIGGAILPGPMMAMRALFSKTAKLPEVELFYVDSHIGKNTEDNIRIGVVNGTYYALKAIISKIKEELGGDVPVIATGGNSPMFNIKDGFFDILDSDLTLKGIAVFCERVRRLENNPAG